MSWSPPDPERIFKMEKFFGLSGSPSRATLVRNTTENQLTHPLSAQEELINYARREAAEENEDTTCEQCLLLQCHPLSPIYEEPGLEIPPPPDYSPQAGESPALLPVFQTQRQAMEHERYQFVQEQEAHTCTVTSAQYTSEQHASTSSFGALSTGTGRQPTGSDFAKPSQNSTRVPLNISETSARAMKQVIAKFKGVPPPEKGDN